VSKVKLEFYGQIQEMDGVYVILISSSLARVAKGLKGEQRMVTVEL